MVYQLQVVGNRQVQVCRDLEAVPRPRGGQRASGASEHHVPGYQSSLGDEVALRSVLGDRDVFAVSS